MTGTRCCAPRTWRTSSCRRRPRARQHTATRRQTAAPRTGAASAPVSAALSRGPPCARSHRAQRGWGSTGFVGARKTPALFVANCHSNLSSFPPPTPLSCSGSLSCCSFYAHSQAEASTSGWFDNTQVTEASFEPIAQFQHVDSWLSEGRKRHVPTGEAVGVANTASWHENPWPFVAACTAPHPSRAHSQGGCTAQLVDPVGRHRIAFLGLQGGKERTSDPRRGNEFPPHTQQRQVSLSHKMHMAPFYAGGLWKYLHKHKPDMHKPTALRIVHSSTVLPLATFGATT